MASLCLAQHVKNHTSEEYKNYNSQMSSIAGHGVLEMAGHLAGLSSASRYLWYGWDLVMLSSVSYYLWYGWDLAGDVAWLSKVLPYLRDGRHLHGELFGILAGNYKFIQC